MPPDEQTAEEARVAAIRQRNLDPEYQARRQAKRERYRQAIAATAGVFYLTAHNTKAWECVCGDVIEPGEFYAYRAEPKTALCQPCAARSGVDLRVAYRFRPDMVWSAIPDHAPGATYRELADATNVSLSDVCRIVCEWVKSGDVRTDGMRPKRFWRT
jgi:hypothetical protein